MDVLSFTLMAQRHAALSGLPSADFNINTWVIDAMRAAYDEGKAQGRTDAENERQQEMFDAD